MENNISYSITNGTGPIKAKIDTSNTHIHDCSLSWLGTCTL